MVSNPYGQAASLPATLAIGTGILITQQPVSAYLQPGSSATYTVVASSSLPLTYQWFSAVPGTWDFLPIAGARSSSYTLTNAAFTQSGTDFYVAVSNGYNSPQQSDTVSLLVGALGSVPLCSSGWLMLGTTSSVDPCTYQLTAPTQAQAGELVWPSLIATGSIRLSFTVAIGNTSPIPADGFAVVFGDPALGATLYSVGSNGGGLGACGIPGLIVAFDDYQNPSDPHVSYIGIGRGESALCENPYFNVNTTIPALATYGQTISHDYVVTLNQGYMSMTMDSNKVFSGLVPVPSVAYLYVTSSTGAFWEQTVISNLSVAVSTP